MEGLSDNADVLIERVEDVYFSDHGWKIDYSEIDQYYGGVQQDFIRAFTAYHSKDGTKLLITPHY